MNNQRSSVELHPASRLAVRYFEDRRLIVLTLMLVVASGLSSLWVLPRMEDPLAVQRAATIVTVFPGADAELVEALVTEKIEEQLQDVPEIKRLRSQSRAGSSFISVELRDEIEDSAPIWSKVRGKLEDSISLLPDGASRPEFSDLEISAYAWIGALVWERDDAVSYGVLRRLARELKDEFFAVGGTKLVDLFGDPEEEVLVELAADRLAAVGLSAAEVAEQLARRDVRSSAGILRDERSELVVEMKNRFRSIEEILQATLQTSVAPTGNVAANEARVFQQRAGQSLRLMDVATVRRTTQTPPAALTIVDGKPGIVLGVMLRPSDRIDRWTKRANLQIEQYVRRLPAGVKLQVIMEQNRYVTKRLDGLAVNLLLGVAAVSLVTFLFLGWRSSLLVTATLPIASLMVLSGMQFLNIPIHQMSVTGLIIALGLLIDNAIIAADEIEISMGRGLSPGMAVGDMVSRLFAPLIASTVTTALAFAPIVLMEGPAGEFVGSIAITVMLAIFSSLFLALTVLPACAALLHRGELGKETDGAGGSRWRWFGRRILRSGISIPPLTRAFRWLLYRLLSKPAWGLALGMVLPIAGFLATSQLREQFFPPADRDQFQIEMELASDASLGETLRMARQIDEHLLEHSRIEHTTWFIGESAPAFYYNVISRRKNSPNYAQAIVTLDSDDDALALIRSVQSELDKAFPGARLLVRQLEQGPPFDAPVELRLFGPDLDQLKETGEELRQIVASLPDVLHVNTALSDFRPAAAVAVDPFLAEWIGISEKEVAQQLFAQLDGLSAGTIIEGVEEVPVRVRLMGDRRRSIEDLRDGQLFVSTRARTSIDEGELPLGTLQKTPVPVGSIAEITIDPQRSVITRYNGRRMNEVQGFITAGTLPSAVVSRVMSRLEATQWIENLPAGYRFEIGGEASERNAAVERLLAPLGVLVVGMVAALVLALASFRLAGLIGVVALLSIGLGTGSLWLFGYPLGFMAIVGTMGLVGIAINDSIVVVAALRNNPLAQAGEIDAAVETVLEVSRHVLATTATTVVGFMPLVLAGGGFWPPLAISIAAGVIGATLISLTFVPCAMQLFAKSSLLSRNPKRSTLGV